MTQRKKQNKKLFTSFIQICINWGDIFQNTQLFCFLLLFILNSSFHKNVPIGSGTVTTVRCNLVGVDVVLLKCVAVGSLWGLKCSSHANGSGSLPAAYKSWCRTPALCLLSCCHPSYHDDNGINLWSSERAPNKWVLIWVALVIVSFHSNRNPKTVLLKLDWLKFILCCLLI